MTGRGRGLYAQRPRPRPRIPPHSSAASAVRISLSSHQKHRRPSPPRTPHRPLHGLRPQAPGRPPRPKRLRLGCGLRQAHAAHGPARLGGHGQGGALGAVRGVRRDRVDAHEGLGHQPGAGDPRRPGAVPRPRRRAQVHERLRHDAARGECRLQRPRTCRPAHGVRPGHRAALRGRAAAARPQQARRRGLPAARVGVHAQPLPARPLRQQAHGYAPADAPDFDTARYVRPAVASPAAPSRRRAVAPSRRRRRRRPVASSTAAGRRQEQHPRRSRRRRRRRRPLPRSRPPRPPRPSAPPQSFSTSPETRSADRSRRTSGTSCGFGS